jgi:ppGpp synthetase/RelA/SpoT-type nucleotidyltranferase
MVERTIEDRLREEYFALLPEIRLVVEQLETEIGHRLLPILQALNPYERLLVTSRVKECESAVDAVRRRQEGATFDRERPERYTLTNLNDLAGVRVLVFPRSRISDIDGALRERFSSWTSDPVPGFDDEDAPVALKYYGYCDASSRVRGEYQIVPMLTGLFWEIEHSTIYKPTPELKGIAESLEMQQRTQEVLDALKKFEEEFEKLLRQSSGNT